MYLSHFRHILPKYRISQEEMADWQVQAQRRAGIHDPEIEANLLKMSIGEGKIASRYFHTKDASHQNWGEMELYGGSSPLLSTRMAFFKRCGDEIFDLFYQNSTPPGNLIHVTCTGYSSPSSAQKIVSAKNWGNQTVVTHAYHMGCYGALPAIRMAKGWCGTRVDIVHTELSSAHFQPGTTSIEQLVVKSLFADGFIKYEATSSPPLSPSFEVLALHEIIVPNTDDEMTWECTEAGFVMTLAKEIPLSIRKAILQFLDQLAMKAGTTSQYLLKTALFAIHPGGPKIIDQISRHLQLAEAQIVHSQEILKTRGNMSSATLPHIWETILSDKQTLDGKLVVSMAFGPGLTISGSIMTIRKSL